MTDKSIINNISPTNRIAGEAFDNGISCKGLSYKSRNGLVDVSIIKISGRYPESGWALNEISEEIVYIKDGAGKLLFDSGESLDLKPGDMVCVEPKSWFAWQGDMELIMTCSPAFDSKQYKIKDKV